MAVRSNLSTVLAEGLFSDRLCEKGIQKKAKKKKSCRPHRHAANAETRVLTEDLVAFRYQFLSTLIS